MTSGEEVRLPPLMGATSDPTPPITRQPSPSFYEKSNPIRSINEHAQMTCQAWEALDVHDAGEAITLDGESLSIWKLVAVAKYGSIATLDTDPAIVQRVNDSILTLRRHLDEHRQIYGVNTGFGGSADSRTSDHPALQQALTQHQSVGILTSRDIGRSVQEGHDGLEFGIGTHSMEPSWVRGTMLTRVNSIIKGHSAVSLPIIEGILTLLKHDLTPVTPLRGSISASGDLSPLSYIANLLEGNPDIFVHSGKKHGFKIISAPEALKLANLEPISLSAKEGLGLINGTATSASIASIALHETNQLALLSQALTSMCVEALCASAHSFNQFLSAVRPHRGQIESAANIYGFLSGSKLAHGFQDEDDDKPTIGLAQDRYALRTASQWIGPQLEDLMLATEQLTVELNSTTDNPLIDIPNDLIHHGGNFQAVSVSSAMEKSRLVIQMIGKMLFAQGTEIINPMMNKGLPASLAADDPSLSFTCKGVEINLAAYMSELAFLANPVTSHVQSAEMHNQALNSLALLSARYTMQAVEVLSLMSAAYLFCLCQALDLRVLQQEFFKRVRRELSPLFLKLLTTCSEEDISRTTIRVWNALTGAWDGTTTHDLIDRASLTAEAAKTALFADSELLLRDPPPFSFSQVHTFQRDLAALLNEAYTTTRASLFQTHTTITPTYLGRASRALYTFVRVELGVPFHRGLVEHPAYALREGEQASVEAEKRKTIGRWISIIYETIRDGRVMKGVVGAVREAEKGNAKGKVNGTVNGESNTTERIATVKGESKVNKESKVSGESMVNGVA